MKKLLAISLAGLWSWSARAQGTFTFSNLALALGLNQPVVYYGTFNGVAGPTFVAAIFLNGTQLGAPAPFRTGAGAGYWNAGADNQRVVQGKFSGDMVSGFTVKVWDSRFGDTYDKARFVSALVGESAPFAIVLGGPKADPLQPPDLPGSMLNFTHFSVGMPEPSVLALGALGAAVMMTCHRRQQPKVPDGQIESG